MNTVDTRRLHPHQKNGEYFADLTGDEYAALVEDIRDNGITTPLLVTADYTVIAGHQRLRAALELGLSELPVLVRDVPEDEAERLLIADNLLRRHLDDMARARLVRRLKEMAGIAGSGRRKNGQNVRFIGVAAEAGIDERQARRLDRLNELVPELQVLVSSGNLGTTQGEALSRLTPQDQQALLAAIGQSAVSALSVQEAKGIRQAAKEAAEGGESLATRLEALQKERDYLIRQRDEAFASAKLLAGSADRLRNELAAAQAAQENGDASGRVAELEARVAETQVALDGALRKAREAESREPSVIEKIVEKTITVRDPGQDAEIERLQAALAAVERQKQEIQAKAERLGDVKVAARDLEQKRQTLEGMLISLHKQGDLVRIAGGVRDLGVKIRKQVLALAPELDGLLTRMGDDGLQYLKLMDRNDAESLSGSLRQMAAGLDSLVVRYDAHQAADADPDANPEDELLTIDGEISDIPWSLPTH